MASAGGEWIVTIDEDGQHDPSYIGSLLDRAMETGSGVVYAQPSNQPPHGFLRNWASRTAKKISAAVFNVGAANDYQSFRLIIGDIGRSVAAYSGTNVYLDVALGWIAGKPAVTPVPLREEGGRASGYSTRKLISHFWRMVLTSGTRGLRLVSAMGFIAAAFALALTIWAIVARFAGQDVPAGWASTVIVILFSAGAILVALGVIAEYLGVTVKMALGQPSYVIVSDPNDGPLGRERRPAE
jgi:undecaprenyl-phosphate 4-deoxy-4-formamido-L-arabinose transferase